MHEEKPSVYWLPVHLQDQQMVYFGDNDDLGEVVECNAIKKTALTEWFMANQTFPAAKQVSYLDFPHHFVWQKKNAKWNPHQRGDVIGRMYFVHPSAGESFYLRMLLITVKGAESWEDLRRFQGILHPTFKVACLAHGLLEDNGEWKKCLEEAGAMQKGHQLHSLFVAILLHCHASLPHVLWNSYRAQICDDLKHRLTAQGHLNPTEDDIFGYGLHLIQGVLMASEKSLQQYPEMPLPQQNWDVIAPNLLLNEQLASPLSLPTHRAQLPPTSHHTVTPWCHMSNRFDSMSRPNYPLFEVSSLISLSAFYLLISNFSLPVFKCFL